MKTITKFTLAATFLFSFSFSYGQWGQNKVVGSGNVTTETFSVGTYDEIKSVGSIDIHLIEGSEGSITVTTDDNLHEYLEIEVKNNELIVKTKKNNTLKTKNGIHVTIPFQDLSAVRLVGSGNIDTKDTIKAATFNVAVTGSGDIELSVDASSVKSKITGSGDIYLKGKTNSLDVTITGSGDFKGYELISNSTDVQVSGSGDAKVYAKESIKARVNGSGDISYHGNPERKDTKTAGSGNISSN